MSLIGLAMCEDNCIYNEETGECIPESDIIASIKEAEWDELRHIEKKINKLILNAHNNLTRKLGRPNYAPTAQEIEMEIIKKTII